MKHASLNNEQKLILSMAAKIFASRTIGAESAVSVANNILTVARTIAEAENVEVDVIGEVAATIFSSPGKPTATSEQGVNTAIAAAKTLLDEVRRPQ